MAEEPTSLHAIHCLQIMLCTMLGGGSLGRLAAEQPAAFRILPGTERLPYSRREITRVQGALIERARAYGLDPDALPPVPTLTAPPSLPPPRAHLQLIDLQAYRATRDARAPETVQPDGA